MNGRSRFIPMWSCATCSNVTSHSDQSLRRFAASNLAPFRTQVSDLIHHSLCTVQPRSQSRATAKMSLNQRQRDPFFRSLPFDQQLARASLQSINPGPDGVACMSKSQCRGEVYDVKWSGEVSPATTAVALTLRH